MSEDDAKSRGKDGICTLKGTETILDAPRVA